MPAVEHCTGKSLVFAVDDEPADREFILGSLLLMDNIEPSAYAAVDGMLLALERSAPLPRLIILDLLMPPDNTPDECFRALRTLRERDDWAAIPTLCLTIEQYQKHDDELHRLGVSWIVRKPVDPEFFGYAVREAMEGRVQREESRRERLP